MSDFWPPTQIAQELEGQRARNERLRWLVEARQILQGETPVHIPWPDSTELPEDRS